MAGPKALMCTCGAADALSHHTDCMQPSHHHVPIKDRWISTERAQISQLRSPADNRQYGPCNWNHHDDARKLQIDTMINIMSRSVTFCRASGVRFQPTGDSMPTAMPGCGCIVSVGAAEVFLQNQCCGLCKEDVSHSTHEALTAHHAALQLLWDVSGKHIHRPMIRGMRVQTARHSVISHVTSAAHDSHQGSTDRPWLGSQDENSFYAELSSDSVKVKDPASRDSHNLSTAASTPVRWVQFPQHDSKLITATVHGIFSQYYASLVCGGVAKIEGLDWRACEVIFAMPSIARTLRSYGSMARQSDELPILLCMFKQLAADVACLHSYGIVHCGIDPSNVMVSRGPYNSEVLCCHLLLTDFSRSHRHSRALDLDLNAIPRAMACRKLGCATERVQPREMEGHVCPAVDVHDLGQTFAFAAKTRFEQIDVCTQPEDVVDVHRRMLSLIQRMTDKPHQCSLVGVAAAFDDLRTTLNMV